MPKSENQKDYAGPYENQTSIILWRSIAIFLIISVISIIIFFIINPLEDSRQEINKNKIEISEIRELLNSTSELNDTCQSNLRIEKSKNLSCEKNLKDKKYVLGVAENLSSYFSSTDFSSDYKSDTCLGYARVKNLCESAATLKYRGTGDGAWTEKSLAFRQEVTVSASGSCYGTEALIKIESDGVYNSYDLNSFHTLRLSEKPRDSVLYGFMCEHNQYAFYQLNG